MNRIDRNNNGLTAPASPRAGRAGLILAAFGWFCATAGAADGERMASDHGCLNCHYAESHSAPTLQRLAGKLARDADHPEALQGVLRETRGHSSIHGHQQVSDESALAILQWMAQGAKAR